MFVRRSENERVPFFARQWTVSEWQEIDAEQEAPQANEPFDRSNRTELANLLPFYLRFWPLTECIGSELYETNRSYSLPVGSQYSNPLCDASSAIDYDIHGGL